MVNTERQRENFESSARDYSQCVLGLIDGAYDKKVPDFDQSYKKENWFTENFI